MKEFYKKLVPGTLLVGSDWQAIVMSHPRKNGGIPSVYVKVFLMRSKQIFEVFVPDSWEIRTRAL